MQNEVYESYLTRVCRCSYPIIRKYLCRAEFAHIIPNWDKGKFGRKLNRRYLNVDILDIERLKNLVKTGKKRCI